MHSPLKKIVRPRRLISMAASEKEKENVLPLSRIKTIMKSSPDVSSISQEALFMTGKATEMFVQNLARVSLVESKDKTNVQYGDLAEVVNSDDTLQFLQDIIPKKILAREYLEKLSKENGDET